MCMYCEYTRVRIYLEEFDNLLGLLHPGTLRRSIASEHDWSGAHVLDIHNILCTLYMCHKQCLMVHCIRSDGCVTLVYTHGAHAYVHIIYM